MYVQTFPLSKKPAQSQHRDSDFSSRFIYIRLSNLYLTLWARDGLVPSQQSTNKKLKASEYYTARKNNMPKVTIVLLEQNLFQ